MPTTPKPKNSITARWRCQLANLGPGWNAAGGGTVSSHKDRARVILKGANYATMLAYLWRRFGPPPTGWDPHKELVNYWLTTPVDGIAFGLACSPSFESCGAGVSYAIDATWARRAREWESGEWSVWLRGFRRHLMTDEHDLPMAIVSLAERDDIYALRERYSPPFIAQLLRLHGDYVLKAGPMPQINYFEEWPGMEFGFDRPPVAIDKLDPAPHRKILAAIEAGLRDLLRPVSIRDVYVNACGRVPDNSPLIRRAVPRFEDAGYGCRTMKAATAAA